MSKIELHYDCELKSVFGLEDGIILREKIFDLLNASRVLYHRRFVTPLLQVLQLFNLFCVA